MPIYAVRNENYRDELLKVPYPFDQFFEEDIDDLYIGMDVFIDAHFYFKTPVTLPISLSEIDGTFGDEDEVRLRFIDNESNSVGVCVFASGEERASIFNPQGINIGILVMDSLGSGRFVSSVQGRYYQLVPGTAAFHIDVCKVSRQSNVRYVTDGTSAAYGPVVNIIARHGVQWSINGDVLSLDVLGEDPTLNDDTSGAILSVNGVSNPTIWLNNTPESNLRITTDNALIFNQAKDVTA